MKERVKRVALLIKEVVAEIILKEISDPNLGFVTVTGVEMGRDLKKTTIYFTVLGDERKMKQTETILNRAKGFIRHTLSQKITLRFIPELDFKIDQLALQERKVGKILDDLKDKD